MGLLGKLFKGDESGADKSTNEKRVVPNSWDFRGEMNKKLLYFYIDFKRKTLVVDIGGNSGTWTLDEHQPVSVLEGIRSTIEEIFRNQAFIDVKMASGFMNVFSATDLVNLRRGLVVFEGQIRERMPKRKPAETIDPYKEAAERSEESGKRAEERRFEVRQAVHRKFFEPR